MATILAIPVLGALIIIQSVLISQMRLLHGTADLVLLAVTAWALHERTKSAWQWALIAGLLMTLASALPLGLALVSYLIPVALALALRRRVWRIPIMAMLVTTFASTALVHLVTAFTLRVLGTPLNLLEALNLVALPGILLNLLFALPMYAIIHDLGNWVYPQELEV